jgi:anti-sigma regulatory factor (Ser/Thr protein kinase)
MGQLRSVARAYAMEGHPPAVVVQRMNLYHRTLKPDDLTTLVYAVIEPDLGRLRLANAGHPPPALLVPGQEARLLEGAAPALGVTDMVHVREQVVDVPAGAVLLLYTDGLVERRGEGIDDGLARLTGALHAAGSDLAAIERAVLGACLDGASSDDDVTALLVRAEPELGARARFTLTPDADTLAALRRTLRRWLEEAGADPADVAAMTMAANEAWQNAIEHAHGFAPVPVEVEFELRGDEAIVTTRDAGTGSPGLRDPDRGRGIELMRALADDAAVDFGGPTHGGCVVLRRRIASAPLSGRN